VIVGFLESPFYKEQFLKIIQNYQSTFPYITPYFANVPMYET